MNFLEFPVEILTMIYEQTDIKSKGRLRKTSKTLNEIFVNPKLVFTKEIAEKWDQIYQKILGLTVIHLLFQGRKVFFSNPKTQMPFLFMYPITPIQTNLLFSFDVRASEMINQIKNILGIRFESCEPNQEEDDGLYGVFKIENVKNILDDLDLHCRFIYELVMLMVCTPQKKNKKIVSRYQFANILKNCNEYHLYPSVLEPYSFIHSTKSDPNAKNSSIRSSIQFYQEIKDLTSGCLRDVIENRMDTLEAIEFYKRLKL
jgi:hypothetical protein